MTAPLAFLARSLVCGLLLLVVALGPARSAEPPAARDLAGALDDLDRQIPDKASGWTRPIVAEILRRQQMLEQDAVVLADAREGRSFDETLQDLRSLLDAKRRLDAQLDRVLDQRRALVPLGRDEAGRQVIRDYLAGASALIDASGRLRYLLADAIATFKQQHATTPVEQRLLVELLGEFSSTIGATVVVDYLQTATPPSTGEPDLRSDVLTLIAESRQNDLLPQLAEFLAIPDLSAELVVQTAETIRAIGLPQTPRPDTSPDLPRPAITAPELRDRLNLAVPGPALANRHAELLAWLDSQARAGLSEPVLRVGAIDVRPGDWLLMRNPSPYNLFTDLSPGLFTHVGVVALEQGSDGIQRLVVLDLAEHGTRMPVTNIDTYLKRTLHYAFLRDPSAAVAQSLAEAARSLIGNEIEFDLTFETDRVLPLRHTPLAGRKVHTYCAGLLLLCALQTDIEWTEFFPIVERPAPGHTIENLAKLGMSIGDNFISPTGALFSPRMEIVGRREPMYDPRREVEEAVFDHFAAQMRDTTLDPAPDLFNALRLKLAEASQLNPLLAQALTAAVDVNVDLVAGAKAAAVIDTLDEIAFGSSEEFLNARDSLRAGSLESLKAEGFGPDELAAVEGYRTRHAALYDRLQQGTLTPRELRIALVDYYRDSGRRELDRRFFGGSTAAPPQAAN